MAYFSRFTSPLAVSLSQLRRTYDRASGKGCCAYSGVCTQCVKAKSGLSNVYVFHTAPQHSGTDLTTSGGAIGHLPVKAIAPGRVVFAGTAGGAGNHVELVHPGGYASRYLHLSEISVSKGDVVRRRQQIGRVGSTGESSGNHLHLEIYSGVPMNVTSVYGSPGKVRLPEMDAIGVMAPLEAVAAVAALVAVAAITYYAAT